LTVPADTQPPLLDAVAVPDGLPELPPVPPPLHAVVHVPVTQSVTNVFRSFRQLDALSSA
jgi:hypothetical protein